MNFKFNPLAGFHICVVNEIKNAVVKTKSEETEILGIFFRKNEAFSTLQHDIYCENNLNEMFIFHNSISDFEIDGRHLFLYVAVIHIKTDHSVIVVIEDCFESIERIISEYIVHPIL